MWVRISVTKCQSGQMRSRNEKLPLELEIQQAEDQLHIWDGIVRAIREPQVFVEVVLAAATTDSARTALQARFGVDELQATAMLDLQFRRATREDSERIEVRRRELVDHLAYLRSLTT